MSSKPIISLAALTVLELPPWEQIRVAAQAGFDAVGIRLLPAAEGEPHQTLLGQPQRLKQTKKALADTGLRVIDIEILRLKPNTDVRQDYEEVLALGAELGADSVLVAGNDDSEARTIDNFAKLCELSLTYNLFPHLEFMPWTGVVNLPQARRIVQAVRQQGHNNACMLIDPFHLNRSHSAITEVAKIPPGWMRYAQLCDIAGPPPSDMDEIIRQARNERCFPGQGDVDLKQLLMCLPADLPLSLEVPTEALRQQGVPPLERAQRAIEAALSLLRG
ncbi:sugar phosphate isomerase/epimerase family protein [Halioxenophilus aromaticivorans]|uniref:TIM barrel protein n=1 Tax=Halioxenophilus aromaticivorans TaxID=1306992 RepID=A0AAV3U1M5_9ALTE